MNLAQLREHREVIAQLARQHGVREVQVFGSTVRGEAGPHSDLDLLVSLQPGLLDRAAFLADLQDLLGLAVDVVNPATLHPLIRDRVQREAQPL